MRSGLPFFSQASRSVRYLPRLDRYQVPSVLAPFISKKPLSQKILAGIVSGVTCTAFGCFSTQSEQTDSRLQRQVSLAGRQFTQEVDISVQEKMFRYFSKEEIVQAIALAVKFAELEGSIYITEEHLDAARLHMKYSVPVGFDYKPRDAYSINESIAIRQAAVAVVGTLVGLEVYKISAHNLIQKDGLTDFIPTAKRNISNELHLRLAPIAAQILTREDTQLADSVLTQLLLNHESYPGIRRFVQLSIQFLDAHHDCNVDKACLQHFKNVISMIKAHKSHFEAIKDALLKEGFLRGSDIKNMPEFKPTNPSLRLKR